MVTVGFDFGTHQTKICYETVEAGTTFYKVFRFNAVDGGETLTLPSFVRLCDDGTLRYGHEAISDGMGGKAVTYFKQVMFSWTSDENSRIEAERWSVLYLAFVMFRLDEHLRTTQYIVHMGMPTDANPEHYDFCKRQAVKVMASAMLMARNVFKGDLKSFLSMSCTDLLILVEKCMKALPDEIDKVRKICPIFVFPEAYVALIPLIKDHKLPMIGPNLFVDIGGGTVDISFFTNQMDESLGQNRPCLYYYHSIPYGLNMITRQNLEKGGCVKIDSDQITGDCASRFHQKLIHAVDEMMAILKKRYVEMGRHNVMPFANLCGQVLDGRPVCYSGGGSMFRRLKPPVTNIKYNFSQVTTVSELIDHSKLYVNDEIFHVLSTAFALSHNSLKDWKKGVEPDAIKLVSINRLFGGIHVPTPPKALGAGVSPKKKWQW